MVAKNNRVPNDHLRKDWHRRVKYFFDDPARKKRRAEKRRERQQRLAPRPIDLFRPIVHEPTARYNRFRRLGRGFTRAELVAARIDPCRARFIGIAVDRRRAHTGQAQFEENVQRLNTFKSCLVRVKKGEKAPEMDADVVKELLAGPRVPEIAQKVAAITEADRARDLWEEKQARRKKFKDEIKAKKEAKYKK